MNELAGAKVQEAQARGELELLKPRAIRAYYDGVRDRVVVELTTGVEIGFRPHDAQGLRGASRSDLRHIELDPFGPGIRFPALDADYYVPRLVEGVLGSARWMKALAEERARPARRIDPKNTALHHPQRALADLKRLRTQPTPGSRATIGHRESRPVT